MHKESTTFGLSSKQLARLLNIGSDSRPSADGADEGQKKADLLHDWLAATLPLDAALENSLPAILRRLCQGLRPLAEKPFGELLTDPNTDIVAIRKIKGFGKKMVGAANSEAEHDVAAVVYYAAIASALLFHNQRITKFSHDSLESSFSALAEHTWLTPDLADLFKKCIQYLSQEGKDS